MKTKKRNEPKEVRRLPPIGNMTANEYLKILRDADQIFTVEAIMTLYAEARKPDLPKVVISKEKIGGTTARTTTLTQGVPGEQMKVPVPRTVEIEEEKPTEGQLIEFPRTEDGRKYVPEFGGPRGIMDRAVRRAAKAIRHRLFKESVLGSISYSVGENGSDLPINDDAIVTAPPWQQQINVGPFGKKRVWQIKEVAKNLKATIRIRINSAAPVSREEVIEILHALEGGEGTKEAIGFGPTDHGSFTITDIQP